MKPRQPALLVPTPAEPHLDLEDEEYTIIPLFIERFFYMMKTKTNTSAVENARTPPFWGARPIPLSLDTLFSRLNRPALFRIGWGAGKAQGDKWVYYQDIFNARLAAMKADLARENWLTARGAYGYWKCASTKTALRVFPDPNQSSQAPITLPLPRQPFAPHRSLCDYFVADHAPDRDIIAFQVVTMGGAPVEHIKRLRQSGDLVEAYFAHGLATQLTEAAASFVAARIRAELGLPPAQGKRYAWGYEPLPDLSQQVPILNLLDPENQLGITFTSAYQFVPEFTTAAMFVSHPDAKYFRMTKEG